MKYTFYGAFQKTTNLFISVKLIESYFSYRALHFYYKNVYYSNSTLKKNYNSVYFEFSSTYKCTTI